MSQFTFRTADLKLCLGQQYIAWKSIYKHRTSLAQLPKGNPILVTGPYRSGTTWVGQMLAGVGLWHLHEPFSPHQKIWPDYFSYRRFQETDSRIDQIVPALISGQLIGIPDLIFLRGIAANRQGMPARLGLYRGAIRRVLIKDPIACLLSEYLVRNHGMTAVLVLRHPAGFVSSLFKLDWDTAAQLRNLLRNEILMEDWLWPFEDLMAKYSAKKSLESHAILFSALWTVLWGFAQRNDNFLIVNYEELCEAPEVEFKKLYQQLNLPLRDEDRARHVRLTHGHTPSEVSSPFDVVRDTSSSRKAWSHRLAASDIGVVRSVWATFDVPFFQEDSDW